MKVVHTYHVVDNTIIISKKLGLSKEEINLAALIGILHDIGRFDELKNFKKFDSVGNDHAFLSFKKELPDYGYEFKKLSLKEKLVWIVKKK